MGSYVHRRFAYRPTPDATSSATPGHEVVIIGAGPVGLTCALDFARRGRRVLLLDADDSVSTGSRAICWAKRSLEIFDRLGVAQPMLDKGVTWSRGRVFFGQDEIWQFDLLPESGHRMPAFINLQQYYVEHYLAEACLAEPRVEIRWLTRVRTVEPQPDGVVIGVDSPEGAYRLHAEWLIACDGVHSTVRRELGLPFPGHMFEDRFLIADVRMHADLPTERRFWFDPPFHTGGSALLHRQPDDVWRIDLQLGWAADPEEERKPERVIPRLRAMLGFDRSFELEWVSVYTFQCRRLERFRHGRVLFAGDSAHQVSPFGARGGNGGIQDADNLVWKLDLVLQGKAPERLLDSYDAERGPAADENIAHSTRATDFITPQEAAGRRFREAALELAREHPFARRLVNSGRLSTPFVYDGSPLNGPDDPALPRTMRPGSPCLDAPIVRNNRTGWLLQALGSGFVGLYWPDGGTEEAVASAALTRTAVPVDLRMIEGPGTDVQDAEGLAAKRYGLAPGTFYLIRPDQHVAARWRRFDAEAVTRALADAIGGGAER